MGPHQPAHWYPSYSPPKATATGPRQIRLTSTNAALCQASADGNPKCQDQNSHNFFPPGKVFVLKNRTTVPRESGLCEHFFGVRPNH